MTKAESERAAVRASVADGGVRSIAAAVSDAGSAAKTNRAVPSEREWNTFLEKILVYGSVAYAWWLTHEFSDGKADDLELSDDEASSIAGPFANMLARSVVNKKWGRGIVDSTQWLDAVVTAGLYIQRTAPAWRRKVGARNIPSSLRSELPNEPQRTPKASAESHNGTVVPRPDYSNIS